MKFSKKIYHTVVISALIIGSNDGCRAMLDSSSEEMVIDEQPLCCTTATVSEIFKMLHTDFITNQPESQCALLPAEIVKYIRFYIFLLTINDQTVITLLERLQTLTTLDDYDYNARNFNPIPLCSTSQSLANYLGIEFLCLFIKKFSNQKPIQIPLPPFALEQKWILLTFFHKCTDKTMEVSSLVIFEDKDHSTVIKSGGPLQDWFENLSTTDTLKDHVRYFLDNDEENKNPITIMVRDAEAATTFHNLSHDTYRSLIPLTLCISQDLDYEWFKYIYSYSGHRTERIFHNAIEITEATKNDHSTCILI